MCATTLWPLRELCILIFKQALFIKVQIKYRHTEQAFPWLIVFGKIPQTHAELHFTKFLVLLKAIKINHHDPLKIIDQDVFVSPCLVFWLSLLEFNSGGSP